MLDWSQRDWASQNEYRRELLDLEMRSTLGDSTVMLRVFYSSPRNLGKLLVDFSRPSWGANWGSLRTSDMGGTANIVGYGEFEQELQNRRRIFGGNSNYGHGAEPLTHKRQARREMCADGGLTGRHVER